MTDVTEGEPWREKFKRQYLQLKMGFEGMMLDKIMKQNAIARDVAIRTANGTIGQMQSGEGAEGDDMGIRIGDEINHHYHSEPQPPAVNHSIGTLGKVAIAAGLVGAGAVPGAVAAYMLTRPEPPHIQPAEPQLPAFDSDTRYGLGVSSTPGPPAD